MRCHPCTRFKNDKRDEFSINADYMIGKIAKLYGYTDFGWIKFNQIQRKLPALPFSPSEGDSDAKQKDKTFGYGIGTEIYLIPNKLTVAFQHDYLKSNGSVWECLLIEHQQPLDLFHKEGR